MTTTSIESLRTRLTPLQRDLLNRLWREGRQTNCQLKAPQLFHGHSAGLARKALEDLGGRVVQRMSGPQVETYVLTFLGALLSDDGPSLESLLKRYLEWVVSEYNRDPMRNASTREQVIAALKISPAEADVMQPLVLLSRFWGEGASGGPNWRIGFPADIHDLADQPDLGQAVISRALLNFEPVPPAADPESTSPPSISGGKGPTKAGSSSSKALNSGSLRTVWASIIGAISFIALLTGFLNDSLEVRSKLAQMFGFPQSVTIGTGPAWKVSSKYEGAWTDMPLVDSLWSRPVLLGLHPCGANLPSDFPVAIWDSSGTSTVYLRVDFDLKRKPSQEPAILTIFCDDDAVAFINGTRVTFVPDSASGSGVEYVPANSFRAGENHLAIEARDTGGGCRWVAAQLVVRY